MNKKKNNNKLNNILVKDIMPNKRHTEFSEEFNISDNEKDNKDNKNNIYNNEEKTKHGK